MEAVFFVALTLLFGMAAKYWQRNAKRLHLPPGPKPLPVLGNLLDIPSHYQWLTWSNLAKKYGDVMHFSALGNHIIVLNSFEAATDLLERRSSNYSDRPRMPMAKELIGLDWNMGFMEYGPYWRRHRRAFHQYLHNADFAWYHEVQVQETRKMLRKLLESPEDFRGHIKYLAGGMILRVVYDLPIQDSNDEHVAVANAAAECIAETVIPGSFLVDIFPILKYIPSWFPGAGFKARAARWKEVSQQALNFPFHAARSNFAFDRHSECVVAKLLRKIDGTGGNAEDVQVVKNTAAVAFLGGTDTSTSSMATFFAAMALNPDIQRKAQADLDSVLEPGHLPDFSHKESLPFIQAIVKEVLRWQLVVPVSIPHKTLKDDTYSGYFIPAGSTVYPNAWSILHNEKYYADPDLFNPTRFLDKEGMLSSSILEPEQVAFGFGRRICPGRHFAMNSLFIAFASILTCFDIEIARDADGNPIPIDLKMSPGMLSYPEKFQCSIKPRGKAVPELIHNVLNTVEVEA